MTELKVLRCWKCPNYNTDSNHCSFWERLTVPIGFCHGHPDYELVTKAIRLAAQVAELMMNVEL